ncbi:MAG: hypothetical protein L6V93_11560 [Clostridiales bacterium]|nr:MAG: hypothetical protein L6V93_11560 [Clostridiales bacterium]
MSTFPTISHSAVFSSVKRDLQISMAFFLPQPRLKTPASALPSTSITVCFVIVPDAF